MDIQKEREAFEVYMAEKYKNLMDRRKCLNNGGGYMAWDMNVAWQVWQAAKADAVQWISVEQELPNENSDILFYLDMDDVILDGYYSNNTFIAAYSTHLRSHVSHWMYHPQKPKAQEPSHD